MKVFEEQLEKQGYLTGELAQSIAEDILSTPYNGNNGEIRYPEPFVCGYFKDTDKWVAFDNTDGYCWVEEYDTEEEAKDYIGAI